MAIGLGKKYFVELIDYCEGDLSECTAFMEANQDLTYKTWFELTPLISVLNGIAYFNGRYRCSLVKDCHK